MNQFDKKTIFHVSILFVLLLTINCKSKQNEEPVKKKSFVEQMRDSTKIGNYVLNQDIIKDSTIVIPAMKNWNNVISLRGTDSWGSFDYVCNIYKSEVNRIQLLKQDQNLKNKNKRYTYFEKIISNKEYDTILKLLESSNIRDLAFDLEPEGYGIDGDHFYIALKENDYFKIIMWQEMHRSKGIKKNVIKTFRKILTLCDYPPPIAIVFKEKSKEDTIEYTIFTDDYNLLIDYNSRYKGKSVKKDSNGFCKWKVPYKDSLVFEKNVSVFGILANEKQIKLNKIISSK